MIKPTQEEREIGVKIKLNPLSSVVKGKSVVLVDDSVVRGTTSKQIVKSLKDAGAKEIHLRITSPRGNSFLLLRNRYSSSFEFNSFKI